METEWYTFRCPKCNWGNGIRKDIMKAVGRICINCETVLSENPTSRFFCEVAISKRKGITFNCKRWGVASNGKDLKWKEDLWEIVKDV